MNWRINSGDTLEREFPTEFLPGAITTHDRPPDNHYAALMEAAPGDTPAEDRERRQVIREVVAACLELLPSEDQYVLDAVFSEQVALRPLGQRLGVSHVHARRLREKALDNLQALLVLHPLIRERLNMTSSWENAAFNACLELHDTFRPRNSDVQLRDLIVAARNNLGPSATPLATSAAVASMSEIGGWALQERIIKSDAVASDVVLDVVAQLAGKQRDYGHGNINAFGKYGVLVRMSDKVERFHNLTRRGGDAVNESLDDTLLDLVGYAVIARMLLNNTFNLELESESPNV